MMDELTWTEAKKLCAWLVNEHQHYNSAPWQLKETPEELVLRLREHGLKVTVTDILRASGRLVE
jgi:hypothetical protein